MPECARIRERSFRQAQQGPQRAMGRDPGIDRRPQISEQRMGGGEPAPPQGPHRERQRVLQRVARAGQAGRYQRDHQREGEGAERGRKVRRQSAEANSGSREAADRTIGDS